MREPPQTVAPSLTRLDLRHFASALGLLLLAYLWFDRAFAWIHLPGTPIFVGELVLGLGLLIWTARDHKVGSLIGQSWPLLALSAYMGWGLIILLAGGGGFTVQALRDATIWYYGLFALLMALSLTARPLEWWVDLYGRAVPYIVIWLPIALALDALITDSPLLVPDTSVSVFSHFSSNIGVHAGMALAFLWAGGATNRRLIRLRLPLSGVAIITVITAGMVSRSSLISVGLGGLILLIGLPETRVRLLLFATTLLIAVMGLALVLDVEVTLFRDRTERPVSVQQLADNILSIISPDEADASLSGTSEWRTGFWERVVSDVSEDRPIAGFGFGTNIREMYGEQDEDPPARNPHSSHVNVLARMGWVGALLWTTMWLTWFAAVATARRRFMRWGLEDAGGLALVLMVGVAMFLVNGVFNEVIEGPHSAIWLWSMFGMGSYLAASTPRRRPSSALRLIDSGQT